MKKALNTIVSLIDDGTKARAPSILEKAIRDTATRALDANHGSLIHKQIIAVMKEITAIEKTQQADGFKTRGIDDVYNALQPLFKKHGIFCTSKVLSQQFNDLGKNITEVEFSFYAEDGSSVFSTTRGECIDKTEHGSAKSMAVAHRIALTQMFMIPTETDIHWLSKVQYAEALERIKAGDFQLYFKIESQYRMKAEEKEELQKAIKLPTTKTK